MGRKMRVFLNVASMVIVLMLLLTMTALAAEINADAGSVGLMESLQQNTFKDNYAIEELDLREVKPEYKIEIEGKKGTITRLNNSSVVYEDMFIRYSVCFEIENEPSMMIDLIQVMWDKTQEGVVGTFNIPKIQINGKITNECFLITSEDRANELPITDVVANSYGMLIR